MPKRTDENQKEIVKLFRNSGFSVVCLHTVGKGCPDILVGKNGKNFLFEIKNGSKPRSQQRLTPDEEIFFEEWKGQVDILNSLEETQTFIKMENFFV